MNPLPAPCPTCHHIHKAQDGIRIGLFQPIPPTYQAIDGTRFPSRASAVAHTCHIRSLRNAEEAAHA